MTAVTNWLADPDYPIEQRLRQAVHFAWEAIRLEPGSTEAPDAASKPSASSQG